MSMFRKGILIGLLFSVSLSMVSAQSLEIIPEVSSAGKSAVINDVNTVSSNGWDVWKNYNAIASQPGRDLSQELASGIMDRDTILDYFARFVKYLSQLGIFVWSCFVVYAGYVYATAVFKDGKVSQWNTAIQNAILWVIIITFSYAIMKAIMAAFL